MLNGPHHTLLALMLFHSDMLENQSLLANEPETGQCTHMFPLILGCFIAIVYVFCVHLYFLGRGGAAGEFNLCHCLDWLLAMSTTTGKWFFADV